MELVRNFTKLDKNDAPIAGGKGASLGEMTQAGIPVPPGFVVLAESFEQFIKETDLVQEIDAILDKVDHQVIHTVDDASEKIRALILNASMPSDIATEISKSFSELNAKFVAVRSSATAEDGKDHAWAGQLESYLNVTEDDVITKVKLCWSSLFTPRAIFYRFEKGLHSTKISVAVVVQKMVESEISGIAFSVHPVTEDYNQLIIEAGYGLGEAIVSGSVTPDSYVVEKEPRNILDINIATQNRGLYRSNKSSAEHGNNEWLDIPEPKASTQVLTNDQILELGEIILNIENHYGFPCDIEWAYEEGKFYIVQSRPITTLTQIKDLVIKTTLSKIYSREKALFYFCLWQGSDVQGVRDYIGAEIRSGLFIAKPKGQSGEVWYSNNELSDLTKLAITTINNSPEVREKMIHNIKESWELLRPYFENGKELSSVDEMLQYYQFLVDFWSSINTIFFELPNLEEVNSDFRKEILAMRTATEKYTDQMSTKFVVWFEKTFPTLKHLAYFITPQETKRLADNPKNDDFVVLLEERAKAGCFMLNGQVYPIANLDQLLKENNFVLEQIKIDSANEIKGNVAYAGKVTGMVKVVISKADIKKVEAGDILVSPMTNPEFVPYMQKAAAFVTDEGGITCHAAIVSREMKKPCIIGTKIATQVLKDGDVVEVDADNGVVSIITTLNNKKEVNSMAIQGDYMYVASRELSLLECSLIIQSYRYQFRQLPILEEFGRRLSDGTILVSKESNVDFYRVKETVTSAGDHVLELIDKNPTLLKELAATSITMSEDVVRDSQVLEQILNTDNPTKETYNDFYHKWRETFLSFFPMQVLPLGIERSLELHKTDLLNKYAELLVDWREKTQQAETIHEKLLSQFFTKSKKVFGVDFRYYTDQEILSYLSDDKILDSSVVQQRMEAYVMKWSFDEQDSHILYLGIEAQQIIGYLKNISNSPSSGDLLQGKGIGGGTAEGLVFVITKKSDLQHVPDDVVVVAKVIELEDIHVLKSQKPSAVVTEEGGITSHIAISGRELQIPIVAGVRQITGIVREGDLLLVDANKGEVIIKR